MASEVTEEFVAEVKKKEENFFFEKEDRSTLYYKEDIRQQTKDAYPDAFKSLPEGAFGNEPGTWWIAPPIFVEKEKQRVFWYSPVSVDTTAYRYDTEETAIGNQSQPTTAVPKLQAILAPPSKQELATGRVSFEVHWNVNVSQTGRHTAPKLAEVKSIGTKWTSDDDDT